MEYILDKAILIYKGEHSYIQIHDVGFKKGVPILLAGHPANEEAIKQIIEETYDNIYNHNREDNLTVVDDKILAFSQVKQSIIWWSPSQERNLFFNKATLISSGKTIVPNLIFSKRQRSLNVFAFKGEEKPTPDTKLFVAPFMNTSEGGVCMGNITSKLDEDHTKWEEAFFNTTFTETRQGKFTTKTKDIRIFWRKMIKTKPKTFPDYELVPTKLKLGDLYK